MKAMPTRTRRGERATVSIILTMLLLALLTACVSTADEDARSEALSDTEPYLTATASVNGAATPIAIDDRSIMPYFELGTVIGLDFGRSQPDTVTVIEVIADASGARRYDARLNKELTLTYADDGLITFTLEKNLGDSLSSNSEDYQVGRAYRWYRILSSDGDTETEHGLWLRTDPPSLFYEQTEDESRGTLTGYIPSIDKLARTLAFDRVLWLTSPEQDEALRELGIDPTTLENGFYIHNPEDIVQTYPISEDAVFQVFEAPEDEAWQLVDAEFQTIVDELNTRTSLYVIEIVDDYVVRISERYLP